MLQSTVRQTREYKCPELRCDRGEILRVRSAIIFFHGAFSHTQIRTFVFLIHLARAFAKHACARVAPEHFELPQHGGLAGPQPAPETPLHPSARGHLRVRKVHRGRWGVCFFCVATKRLFFTFFTAHRFYLFRLDRGACRFVETHTPMMSANPEAGDRGARAPGEQRRARRVRRRCDGRAG